MKKKPRRKKIAETSFLSLRIRNPYAKLLVKNRHKIHVNKKKQKMKFACRKSKAKYQ